MLNRITIILVILCLNFSFSAEAQSNILSRTVTVSITNERLDHALDQVASAGHFMFSYNTGIIKIDSIVTINATNETVKSVLDKLFGKRIKYVESGNYLILKKNSSSSPVVNKQPKTTYIITGYVVNTLTGEKVSEASVYDKTSLASALSGPEGFFSLKIPSTQFPSSISASKVDFLDTVIIVKPMESQEVSVPLTPLVPVVQTEVLQTKPVDTVPVNKTPEEVVIDTSKRMDRSGIVNWFMSMKQKMMARNLHFTEHRSFQLSLIPGISTNRKLGSHIVNDFSLNIFGGYTGGTDKMEIGSFFNIDRGDVKYIQLSGFFNLVGGNVKGLQATGFVNHDFHSVTGVQLSGFVNTVLDSVKGVQASGFVNFTRKHFKGVQATGFVNTVLDSVKGVQAAGFVNFALKDVKGIQAAGFVNYARKVNGVQVAGFVNVAPISVTGAQIAGFVNVTKHAHGVRIGIVNLADSSDACPIGLFSFVLHGFHKLELSSNEVTYLNIAFKTGNTKLYNILMAGINPDPNNRYYAVGYGLGHEFPMGKKLGLDLELSYQYLAEFWDTYNGLSKINLNFVYQPSPKFGITLGPSLNVLYMHDPRADLFASHKIPALDVPSLDLIDRNDFKEWVGFHAGVRFF